MMRLIAPTPFVPQGAPHFCGNLPEKVVRSKLARSYIEHSKLDNPQRSENSHLIFHPIRPSREILSPRLFFLLKMANIPLEIVPLPML